MASSFHSSSKRIPQRTVTNIPSVHQSLTVFVGNLSFDTNEADLEAFFNDQCGDVRQARILYDSNTRHSRGFGFLYFNTIDAFKSALQLQGCKLNGRELRIAPAEDKNSASSVIAAVPQTTANRSKTQVVHCKKSNYDVYIGRPSDWGNPFVIGKDGDRADVIRKYRNWIMSQPELLTRAKKELRGQRIACWCKPEACHGDVIAEIADVD